jgi:hypothetical protein
LAALTLSGCSAPMTLTDAGTDAGYDAGLVDGGPADAGRPPDGGTPYGDAGCVLPSDFPFDAGPAFLAEAACQCVFLPQIFHCFEEGGPRCFSWACPPAKDRNDGGYEYTADGGIICLC